MKKIYHAPNLNVIHFAMQESITFDTDESVDAETGIPTISDPSIEEW